VPMACQRQDMFRASTALVALGDAA
jgi:hypothetical protein